MKYLAKTSGDFKFSEQYKLSLESLQKKFDNRAVAEFWVKEETAKNCCKKIRSKNKKLEPTSNNKLIFDNEQKFIEVNHKQQVFLRFDNENKNGNRIFYSNSAAELMEQSEEYHIDGTFKYCPKLFYQVVTIHCIYKNQAIPSAFIFLQKKEADTYVEALQHIRNNCFNKNLKRVLTDFESSLMIAVNTVFKDTTIKGCWFHYCQAIKKKLFSFGLKSQYTSDWDFRFWIKRFLVLPLMPLEKIQQSMEIIFDKIPLVSDNKQIKFLHYYIKQWLNGSLSPVFGIIIRLTSDEQTMM